MTGMSEALARIDATEAANASEAGEVPAGYKRTEVGVIPEDWNVTSLGSCLRATPDYGINAPAVPFDESMPTYLRITDIGEDNKYRPSPRVSVSHPSSTSYLLAKGELVFARTGASTGKSYLYTPVDGELAFAGFLVRVKPDPERLDSTYFAYAVQSERYWRWVATMSTRSGQPGINAQEYRTFRFPFPKIHEQRAIAKALSSVDDLLESLDALITKKRAIKQAAMQQLLTGKTRLPGFYGPWEEKQLGEIGHFLKGSGVKRDDAQSGALACVRYGEIYTAHDSYVRTFHSWISSEVAAAATPLQYGDLLFAASGETKGEIGKCVAFVSDTEAYAGGDIVILRPSNVSPLFFGYALNTPDSARQKASFGQGDAVVHISSSALAKVSLDVPPIEEQEAIAAVLFDMDAEIAALERRRDKTQTIKQSMMQQLLTGRVRLV